MFNDYEKRAVDHFIDGKTVNITINNPGQREYKIRTDFNVAELREIKDIIEKEPNPDNYREQEVYAEVCRRLDQIITGLPDF